MTFRLRYRPPPSPPEPTVPTDLDDALYDLADAGASAQVELDGYELPLSGTGVVELARGCRSLVEIIDGGTPVPDDDELRTVLARASADAALHQWLFSSWMQDIPVLIFAVTSTTTWIATRTHTETPGWPLVALEGRDLPNPVTVPTALVKSEARGYLAACEADARTAFPDLK
jgi:hypothetical protein